MRAHCHLSIQPLPTFIQARDKLPLLSRYLVQAPGRADPHAHKMTIVRTNWLETLSPTSQITRMNLLRDVVHGPPR